MENRKKDLEKLIDMNQLEKIVSDKKLYAKTNTVAASLGKATYSDDYSKCNYDYRDQKMGVSWHSNTRCGYEITEEKTDVKIYENDKLRFDAEDVSHYRFNSSVEVESGKLKLKTDMTFILEMDDGLKIKTYTPGTWEDYFEDLYKKAIKKIERK